MAIESMVALGLVTFILLLISIYADKPKKHRSEDNHDKKDQNGIGAPD